MEGGVFRESGEEWTVIQRRRAGCLQESTTTCKKFTEIRRSGWIRLSGISSSCSNSWPIVKVDPRAICRTCYLVLDYPSFFHQCRYCTEPCCFLIWNHPIGFLSKGLPMSPRSTSSSTGKHFNKDYLPHFCTTLELFFHYIKKEFYFFCSDAPMLRDLSFPTFFTSASCPSSVALSPFQMKISFWPY